LEPREVSETLDLTVKPESWERKVSLVTQENLERPERRERLVDKVCQDFQEHQDHAGNEGLLDPSV